MCKTTFAITIPLGLFVLAANIQPAAAQQRQAPPRAAHQEEDPVTHAKFAATIDQDGNGRVTMKMDELTLEKVTASSGDTTLRLQQGNDLVAVEMNHGGFVVARGEKTARLDTRRATVEDADAVRTVLLGSQAVRAFRRLTASLENRESDKDGPLMLSTLVDGAIIEMLDGDSGATERVGRRITRRQRARLRPAKLRGDDMFVDCILSYEEALNSAFEFFFECIEGALSAPWYWKWGLTTFCEVEFLIRSQQYIWQFLNCLTIQM